MSDFEKEIQQAIQRKILGDIKKAAIIEPVPYKDRRHLPKDVIDKIWEAVDWDAVIAEIMPKMQTRICNAILGNMEAEVKTDIKKLMGVEGVREKIRMHVYPEIMRVLEPNHE